MPPNPVLETTPDTITPHAGLALSGEFAHGPGLPGLADSLMPLPGSGAGYRPSEFVMPLAGHLAENGLLIFDEFREGNDSPGAGNLDFIEACCARMPCGRFWAGAVFFRIGILAYNLFRLFELKVLPDPKSADWALLAGASALGDSA